MSDSYTILVVDDEKIVRDAIAAHIAWEEHNTRALAASDALEALDILKREPVDLILLDIRLRSSTGWSCSESWTVWQWRRRL